MNVDTGQFEALRARVEQLAGQQEADREELGRTRWLVGDGLDRIERVLLGVLPQGRPAAGRHLRSVR